MKPIEILGKVFGLAVGLVFFLTQQENDTLLWGWFFLVMATIGIPHGAIDHLIYHKKTSTRTGLLKFLYVYLGIMIIYLVCWWILPVTALILFLIMSAYHFGQANFIPIKVERNKTLLYLNTGFFYLAVILFGDFERTSEILTSMVDIQFFHPYSNAIILTLFVSSSILIARLPAQTKYYYLIELSMLGFILYQMPLLLAFITYFGFWHALPSLMEEFDKITVVVTGNKALFFVKQLLPFSAISLVGITLILVFAYDWLTEKELTLLFFVMVSLISAPHIWIMNRFLETSSTQENTISTK